MIYEFELTHINMNATSYRTIEAETLIKAESILEQDVSLDQEDTTYELYDVFMQEMYDRRIQRAKKFQQELLRLQQENDDHLLSSMIEVMQEGFAVQINPQEIKVYPTLDVNFQRNEE